MAQIKTIAAGHTHADGLCIGDAATSKLAFNGTAPIVQPSGAAQAAAAGGATVDAECRVLANALRTALVNLGLIKGAA